MWAFVAAAWAGDLVVASSAPVTVWVDGQPVPYAPGTLTAHLTGLSGVHKVQVAGGDNVLLAETQVQVPWDGMRTVTYDGVSLVISAPPAPVLVVQAPAPAPPPAPVGPSAMGSPAFAGLLSSVKAATYGSDQLAVIKAAAAKNWFTIEQVGGLVDALTYGSDQVAAVQLCAPKVVDPENAFALGPHFTYSSDKEAALAMFQ